MLPVPLATDLSDNVYVADANNHRIQKFTSTGAFLGKWGSFGSGDGEFSFPTSVTVDGSYNVYVLTSPTIAFRNSIRMATFLPSGVLMILARASTISCVIQPAPSSE
jgi:DNA-binding beta-propeller fold protein YncE